MALLYHISLESCKRGKERREASHQEAGSSRLCPSLALPGQKLSLLFLLIQAEHLERSRTGMSLGDQGQKGGNSRGLRSWGPLAARPLLQNRGSPVIVTACGPFCVGKSGKSRLKEKNSTLPSRYFLAREFVLFTQIQNVTNIYRK